VLRRVLVALAALSVACSLTSLDGLSGGTDPTAPGADATIEGTTTPLDASAEGSPGADAKVDGASFCASAPAGAFCEDFENGLGAWQIQVTDANSFAIDTAASTSPTHAGLSTAYPSANGSPSACLRKVFAGAPRSITVEADVRFEGTSSNDYDLLGFLGSYDHNLSVQVVAGDLQFDEDILPVDGGSRQVFTSTGYKVDSAWHHYRWTNELTGGTSTIELFVDGTKVGGITADARDYAAPFTLEVGDCVVYPSQSPWKVRFDNVLLVTK
jgi:hypothetical protein